eukprot:1196061-Prorocentrum_minimum.AAC.2
MDGMAELKKGGGDDPDASEEEEEWETGEFGENVAGNRRWLPCSATESEPTTMTSRGSSATTSESEIEEGGCTIV